MATPALEWTVHPAGLAAAGVGVLFGIPSVRLKGLYLALTTLGAQIILGWIALYGLSVTAAGFAVPPARLGGVAFDTPQKFYYLAMGFTVLMTFLARNLMRSRIGRAFIAIRDNDRAAEGMGIDIFKYKLLAFAICTFYAGVAGSLLVHYMMWAQLESFTLQDSVWYLAMIIVGGLGTIQGTLYGTVFVTLVPEALRGLTQLAQRWSPDAMTWFHPMKDVLFGAMIVGFLVFEPHGLAEISNRVRRFFALWPFPK